MKTYVISDTHFGHKRILEYEPSRRVLGESIEEHDEKLVALWNSVVRDDDIVYHLGDFCFGREGLKLVGSLRGTKYLVRGNHDKYPGGVYLDAGFAFVENYCVVDKWLLTHIPIHPQEVGRWAGNIHGHLHSERVKVEVNGRVDDRYRCVSCEQVEFKPRLISEVVL